MPTPGEVTTYSVTPSNNWLGIDPGANGGLALISTFPGLPTSLSSPEHVVVWGMPPTEEATFNLVFNSTMALRNVVGCIEQVGGYMQGSGGNIGSAMFKFGWSYGGLRMAMIAAQIPFTEVPPVTWQNFFKIKSRSKGETDSSFKNRIKQAAQELFPDTKLTLKTADAILIAEYCRRAVVIK